MAGMVDLGSLGPNDSEEKGILKIGADLRNDLPYNMAIYGNTILLALIYVIGSAPIRARMVLSDRPKPKYLEGKGISQIGAEIIFTHSLSLYGGFSPKSLSVVHR